MAATWPPQEWQQYFSSSSLPCGHLKIHVIRDIIVLVNLPPFSMEAHGME